MTVTWSVAFEDNDRELSNQQLLDVWNQDYKNAARDDDGDALLQCQLAMGIPGLLVHNGLVNILVSHRDLLLVKLRGVFALNLGVVFTGGGGPRPSLVPIGSFDAIKSEISEISLIYNFG